MTQISFDIAAYDKFDCEGKLWPTLFFETLNINVCFPFHIWQHFGISEGMYDGQNLWDFAVA